MVDRESRAAREKIHNHSRLAVGLANDVHKDTKLAVGSPRCLYTIIK